MAAEPDLTGGGATAHPVFTGANKGGISMVVSKMRTDFGAILGQLTQADRIVQRMAKGVEAIAGGWRSMGRVSPLGGHMGIGSSGSGMGMPSPTFTSSGGTVTNPNAWRHMQFEEPPPMPPPPRSRGGGGQTMPFGNRVKGAIVGAGLGAMAVQQVGNKLGLAMVRDTTFYQATTMGSAPRSSRFGVGTNTASAMSGGYMTAQDYLADVGIMARNGVDFTTSAGRAQAGSLARFGRLTPGMDMGATAFGAGGLFSGQGMNMMRTMGIHVGDPTKLGGAQYAAAISAMYRKNFGNQKITSQDVTRAFRPGSGRLRYSLEHMGIGDDQIENVQQAMTRMANDGGRTLTQKDLKHIPGMASAEADRQGANEVMHAKMQRGVVDGFNASTKAMTGLTKAVSHLTWVLETVGFAGAAGAILGGSVAGRGLGGLLGGMGARVLGKRAATSVLGRIGLGDAAAGAAASRLGGRGGGSLLRGGLYAAGGQVAGSELAAHGHSTAGGYASNIGTGAAIGSLIAPGVGTLIGAGVGALASGGKQLSGWTEKHHLFGTGIHYPKGAGPETKAAIDQYVKSGFKDTGALADLKGHYNEGTGAGGDPTTKGPAGGTGSVSGGAIVSYAMQFVGIPYKWGGSSPKEGFDCSGFTAYVFGHFGIGLPHSSAAQSRMGSAISYNEAAPGDLLFWDTPSHVHHVAIYVGGGKMIAAPHTGTTVSVSRVYGKPFVRRVVKGNRSSGSGASTPNGSSPGQRNFGQGAGVLESGAIATSLSGFSLYTPSVGDILGSGGGPVAPGVGSASTAAHASSSSSGSASSASAASAPSNPKGNVALGQKLAAGYGWGKGAEWNDLYQLWQHESSWSNTAQNPHSTAYGIPQFLDSTWEGTGYRKTADPATQIKAGLKYIKSRYGDPAGAWSHEEKIGWYKQGKWKTGDETANLHWGEMVVAQPEADALRSLIRGGGKRGGGGGGRTVILNVYPQGATYQDAVRLTRQVKEMLDNDDDLDHLGTT